MSVWKKLIAAIVVFAVVAIAVYGLFVLGGGSANREGGLRSPDVRTIVTLSVLGASAFITGFGLRDVIGRVMAARQRSRLAAMREPKKI